MLFVNVFCNDALLMHPKQHRAYLAIDMEAGVLQRRPGVHVCAFGYRYCAVGPQRCVSHSTHDVPELLLI